MNTATARRRLEAMVAYDQTPTLDATEITDLLASSRRVDGYDADIEDYEPWLPLTAYTLGDNVIPTSKNDHYYEVTTAGTTGASEPTWPTADGATVINGGVTFTEAGAALWIPTYDLFAAAAEGWRLKASKVASHFEFWSDNSRFHKEQVFDHCVKMADHYESKASDSIGSIPVGTSFETSTDVAGNVNEG